MGLSYVGTGLELPPGISLGVALSRGTGLIGIWGSLGGNTLPINTVAPTISGTGVVGSLLTGSVGSWTGTPSPTYEYQWYLDGSSIIDATTTAYTPISTDATHTITFGVVGTNIIGSSTVAYSAGLTITAASGAPILANQGIDFGRKTLATYGGVAPANTGGAITGSTTNTLTGTNSSHWAISSAGVITPTASFVASPQSSYTLTCTVYNSSGSGTCTLTITTIINGYSVATTAEGAATWALTGLAFGSRILHRTANYTYSTTGGGTGLSRAVVQTGTWTPPTLYDAVQWHQGYDFSTGSYTTMEPHTGASPIVLSCDVNGYNVARQGIWFKNLTFSSYNLNSGAEYALYNSSNKPTDIAFSGCDFSSSTVDDTDIYGIRTPHAFTLNYQDATGTHNIYFSNNTFHNLWLCGDILGCVNVKMVGNVIYQLRTDSFRTAGACDGFLRSWQQSSDVHSFDYFGGDSTWQDQVRALHPDHAQHITASGQPYGLANWSAYDVGNRFTRGTGVTGYLSQQGFFWQAPTDNAAYSLNLYCAGNIYQGDFANGIEADASGAFASTTIVRNNTIVRDSTTAVDVMGGVASDPQIWFRLDNNSTGGTFRDNFANRVIVSTTDSPAGCFINPDEGNNIEDVSSTYATYFTTPANQLTPLQVSTNFSAKSGGPLDTPGTKIGAHLSYVDFTNRKVDFPWEESGFNASTASWTNVTGAALNTVVSTAKIQLTGIDTITLVGSGPTGVEVRATGGTNPTVTVYDTDGTTVIVSNVPSYCPQNNQYVVISDTTSTINSTTLTITIHTGTTVGTWTTTTIASSGLSADNIVVGDNLFGPVTSNASSTGGNILPGITEST